MTLTAALLELLREAVAESSQRAVARATGLDHTSVSRLVHGRREMAGATVDTLVEWFGLNRVVARMREPNAGKRRPRRG